MVLIIVLAIFTRIFRWLFFENLFNIKPIIIFCLLNIIESIELMDVRILFTGIIIEALLIQYCLHRATDQLNQPRHCYQMQYTLVAISLMNKYLLSSEEPINKSNYERIMSQKDVECCHVKHDSEIIQNSSSNRFKSLFMRKSNQCNLMYIVQSKLY